MGIAVLLLAALAFEDPPRDVIDFFRSMASALADADRASNDGIDTSRPRHATEFLDHFDKLMPEYEQFRDQIEEMVGAGEVATTIDFINSEGDDKKRTLDLDWLLQPEGKSARRGVIRCTIEKRGKKWKVTSIAPVAFFKTD